MHLHVEAMPDEPGTQAFLYGPLVLAGDLGNDGLTEAHIVGPNLRVGAAGVEQHGSPLGPANRTPPVPEIEIPTFRPAGPDPNSWIKPADQPGSFRTVGQTEGRHAGSAQPVVRPALFSVLAGVLTADSDGLTRKC